jgi:hypothetical protein
VVDKVSTIGWTAGSECVGRRGSVVTGWGRLGGEGEGMGREWMRRGRKSNWEGEQWIVVQEKEGE